MFVFNQKTKLALPPGSQLKLNKEPGRQKKKRDRVENRKKGRRGGRRGRRAESG